MVSAARAAFLLLCVGFATAGCGKGKAAEPPAATGSDRSTTDFPSLPLARETVVVAADAGLNLRREPTLSSEAVLLMPDGSVLEVLETGAGVETINGLTGQWHKVSFRGMVGWAFGGYLFPDVEPEHREDAAVRRFAERISGDWCGTDGYWFNFHPDGDVSDGSLTGGPGRWTFDSRTWVLTMDLNGRVTDRFGELMYIGYRKVWRITSLTDRVLEIDIIEETEFPAGITRFTRR